MGNHLGVQGTEVIAVELSLKSEFWTAGTVKNCSQQSLVHRDIGMSVTPDSFFFTQGLLECCPKGQPDVFDTVMAVDLKVAFCFDVQIEKAVKCKLWQLI